MKYAIKIGERTYTVEIEDLEQRPVVVRVDGQPLEVWPVEENPERRAKPVVEPGPGQNLSAHKESPNQPRTFEKALRAPLPGVIQAVNVQVGDVVGAGQELFLIEAMKMRNAIRSNRAGRIAALHVSAGQTVNHNDLLLEYDDSENQG